MRKLEWAVTLVESKMAEGAASQALLEVTERRLRPLYGKKSLYRISMGSLFSYNSIMNIHINILL